MASATVPMPWHTGTPLLDWSCVHPVVYGTFDLRNQKAADAGHMVSKPWAAWLPVIVPKHLPCTSSYTEESTWSHTHSRIYLSPEKTSCINYILLKTGYTSKKADYVGNYTQVWSVITTWQSLPLWNKRATILHDNKTGVSKTHILKDGTANTCSLDETPANRKKKKCIIYIKTER